MKGCWTKLCLTRFCIAVGSNTCHGDNLLGSVQKNNPADWRQAGTNVWLTGAFPVDVGNIIFNNGERCGVKVWKETDLKGQIVRALFTRSELWMNAIRRAQRDGHDFQLHGLTHHCLEFGVPQESIRRHAPRIFEQYEREPEKWEREHTVEVLGKKFGEAVAIYRRAFGERPLVFRAPCFGICQNAYRAMFESGIQYSSNRSVNPAATGYVITGKPELKPWQPDYDGKPFEEPPGVLEIPCLEDLVIRGFEPDEFDSLLNLFKREIKNYTAGLGDSPYGVFGSHYHSMAKQMNLTSRFYEQLFDWMVEQGITEWTTFKAALV